MTWIKNKFGAQKSGSFDSKIERKVAAKFLELQNDGYISQFRRCTTHFLIIPGIYEYYIVEKQLKTKVRREERRRTVEKPAHYTPDFIYYDEVTGEYVALEVKSFITKRQADYPLRRKLFKWKIKDHNTLGRSQWRFEEIEV